MKIYLVGGAVRDGLLDIPVYDRDWVVVDATPDRMLAEGFQQVGKDFPVFLHPKTKEEYALARTERKQGVGYHGFEVFADPGVTLEEDLVRRDLTINAMAQDEDGVIIDPYGGEVDLQQKVLRHVSDAFSEDPLRVLRVARFAAKLHGFGFTLAPETGELMRQMSLSGELENLTPERVWQEVFKALNTPHPHVFFEVLHQVEALPVLFPELADLEGVTQSVVHHPEGDVWTHTMMVLKAAAELTTDARVRFAALVHDVGKALTPQDIRPKHPGHEAAGVALVEGMCQRYRIPKTMEKFAVQVTRYHGEVYRQFDSPDAKQMHEILHALSAYKNVEDFECFLTACHADSLGRKGFEQAPYPQKAFWLGACESARHIDNRALMEKGFKGAALGEAIVAERIVKVQEFIDDFVRH